MEEKLLLAVEALKAIAGGEYESNPFIGAAVTASPREIAKQALEAINTGGALLASFKK